MISLVALFIALYVSYDAKRPCVVVYLDHDKDHGCMYLIVSNQGQGIARDIILSRFDYSMVDDSCLAHAKESFIETGIPLLVPGSSRSTVILFGSKMGDYCHKNSQVTVRYREKAFPFGNHEVTEEYVLDYTSFSKSLYVQSDLHEMTTAVKCIAK